mmetsp:Transcript_38712/g.104831  ORF Transcript_38712/g.104831 Transcript_38712/m.104831 type:complete len:383 (+) Transcript_38712:317-1465(+)
MHLGLCHAERRLLRARGRAAEAGGGEAVAPLSLDSVGMVPYGSLLHLVCQRLRVPPEEPKGFSVVGHDALRAGEEHDGVLHALHDPDGCLRAEPAEGHVQVPDHPVHVDRCDHLHRRLSDAGGVPDCLCGPLLVCLAHLLSDLQRHHGLLLRDVPGEETHQEEVPRALAQQDVGRLPRECDLHHGVCLLDLAEALRPPVHDLRPGRNNLFILGPLLQSGTDVPAAAPQRHPGGLAAAARTGAPGAVLEVLACRDGHSVECRGLQRAGPRVVPWPVRLLRCAIRGLPLERDQEGLWHQGLQQPHSWSWGHDGPLRLPVRHVPVHLRAPQDFLLPVGDCELLAGVRGQPDACRAGGVPEALAAAATDPADWVTSGARAASGTAP